MLAAFALSACGGGGGSPMPSTTAANAPQATRVSLTITFPAKSTTAASAHRRGRDYISPSIESLSLSINNGTPTYINAPAPTNSPQTVTTTVPAPVGNDLFSVSEYDAANGGGNLLGDVMQMNAVIMGIDNIIDVTVNGELAKIAIEAEPSAFVEGTVAAGVTLVGNQPQTFLAVPEDADGNTIVSPGLIPAIGETSAAQAAIAEEPSTNNAFTLQAPAPTANVKITASGTNLEGNSVTASFEADALAALYVADYTIQLIRVFDENGTPLTLPATAFAGLSNPMGLAYVPGTPGSVIVTETSNFEAPYIVSFDPSGNAQALAAGAFDGVSQPLFLAYGASQLFVPNYYNSTLSVFNTSGTTGSPAATAFTKLQQPAGIAYDPHNSELYVTNGGADTLAEYSPSTGAMSASVATGSHPMDAVFDSNNDSIYATFGGTDGNPLNAAGEETPQAPSMAGVDEFSEALAAVSNTGGFTVTSTSSFFTGIAFDPYTKELYVSDAGLSKIDAFTEAGAAVTLPTGAFSTISSTTSPPGDPMGILLIP